MTENSRDVSADQVVERTLRQQAVFLAPLDTVIKQPAAKYLSILKLTALLTRHVVVTDTMLLDNAAFQHQSLRGKLALLFKEPSGLDELPWLVVSSRDPGRPIMDILLRDLAAIEKWGRKPMRFSSLQSESRRRLDDYHAQRKLNPELLQEVGYPVAEFAQPVSDLIAAVRCTRHLGWPMELRDPESLRRALLTVLQSPEMVMQSGLQHEVYDPLQKSFIEQVQTLDAGDFSRTTLYQAIEGLEGFDQVKPQVATKYCGVTRRLVDYLYLRNFADLSHFSFLVDDHHWLPSSIVNKVLCQIRPEAEAADKLAEETLGVPDGGGTDFGKGSLESMDKCLKRLQFEKKVSWEDIIRLRGRERFRKGIEAMEDPNETGVADRSAAAKEHLEWCLHELLKNPSNLREQLVIGAVVGVVGGTAQANRIGADWLITSITGGAGFALILTALHAARHWRKATLIDKLSTSIIEGLHNLWKNNLAHQANLNTLNYNMSKKRPGSMQKEGGKDSLRIRRRLSPLLKQLKAGAGWQAVDGAVLMNPRFGRIDHLAVRSSSGELSYDLPLITERIGAAILPITPQGRIALVRVERPALLKQGARSTFPKRNPLRDFGCVVWEAPRGFGEPSENPTETAVRECQEEIGMAPRRIWPLGRASTNSTFFATSIDLFAVEVEEGHSFTQSPAEAEGIRQVKYFDLKEIEEMVEGGLLICATTQALLFRAFLSGFIWSKRKIRFKRPAQSRKSSGRQHSARD